MNDEEIVFEDLHGNLDEKDSEVDLDDEKAGITILDDDQSSDDDGEEDGDDDAPQGPDDEADDEADDNVDESKGPDERFGKKFKARLDRERRAKQAERERADRAEQELQEIRKERKTERLSELKTQLSDLADEEKQLEADLETAFESGNSKDQARLTARLGKVQSRSERLIATQEALEDEPDEPDTRSRTPEGRPERNELADEWKEDNADWFGRAGFERYTRMANRIDRELWGEGIDPNSEEYFEELTERMKEQAPKLFDDSASDEQDGGDKGKTGRRSPVAGTTREGAGGGPKGGKSESGSKNRIRITAADKENMRKFGLDPNDPKTLREYAENKRQSGTL